MTVLLLSLQTQAAGLTLVRANHVFLLEPALDPAIEQQVGGTGGQGGLTQAVDLMQSSCPPPLHSSLPTSHAGCCARASHRPDTGHIRDEAAR